MKKKLQHPILKCQMWVNCRKEVKKFLKYNFETHDEKYFACCSNHAGDTWLRTNFTQISKNEWEAAQVIES